MRCQACNIDLVIPFLSSFPGEDYCLGCEIEIIKCIEEMNDWDDEEEEEEEDETTPALPYV